MLTYLTRRILREIVFFYQKAQPYVKIVRRDLASLPKRVYLWSLLSKTEPIKLHGSEDYDLEVMTVTSHNDLLLFLCMIKTFLYFGKIPVELTVLDDGTLTKIDHKLLKRFIPDVRVIDLNEAEKKIKIGLKKYENSLALRKGCIYLRKKIDMPYLARKNRILVLDSDILFFRKPEEIVNWVTDKQKNKIIYMKDCWNSYIVSEAEVKYVFKTKLIPYLNSGIIGYPKKYHDMDFVENFCRFLIKDTSIYSIFVTRPSQVQAIWAVMFSKIGKRYRRHLSQKDYVISESLKPIKNVVSRHYVRLIRHLFYDDAIEVLKNIIQEEKRVKYS